MPNSGPLVKTLRARSTVEEALFLQDAEERLPRRVVCSKRSTMALPEGFPRVSQSYVWVCVCVFFFFSPHGLEQVSRWNKLRLVGFFDLGDFFEPPVLDLARVSVRMPLKVDPVCIGNPLIRKHGLYFNFLTRLNRSVNFSGTKRS